ncbi:MAG: pirin family protein [Candidatus Lambdaproteobacteria bacterium]|nr:pirin family protein [Candidatus Lambdaproteobacteria bacterium]
MMQVRRSEERGHAQHGWLDSRFSFSFAEYHDPRFMGFRALRVINEDRVEPGTGFPPHPHRDMEIVTYVLAGAIEHQDSLGNRAVIRPGEVQRMSAGTGVRHAEYNASRQESLHLLQIWLLPEWAGLAPGYEQKAFDLDGGGGLVLVGARDGRAGAVTIHQDVELYAARLSAGQQAGHALKPGRHAWVQVARGALDLNGVALQAGDGAALSGETALRLNATEPTELLLFDLA